VAHQRIKNASITAVNGGHVKHLIMTTLTAMIETNRFQNCPIAQCTKSMHVPPFYVQPFQALPKKLPIYIHI